MDDTNKNHENFALDVIRFLQKWGLWRDVCIYTGGKAYRYDDDSSSSYKTIPNVKYEEGVDPEDYMKGLTPSDCEDYCSWESLANPEHIFDMTYEGPLHMLLSYDEYEPVRDEISDGGWSFIWEHTDLIEEYIVDNYDVSSPDELARQMWYNIFDNPELNYWDPMNFDTWEEYVELEYSDYEGDNAISLHFDTYEEYCAARDLGMDGYISAHWTEVQTVWDKMVEEAKTNITQNDGHIPINGHIYEEFSRLFDNYGLWFEFCFKWSLTCYKRK